MSTTLEAIVPPIRRDESGALRVGRSQVLLELVIRAFQDGATPETIVQRYPAVSLADVYGAVAYYLREREAVDQYLAERERLGDEVMRKVHAPADDLVGIRERLRAARSPRGT